jgi:hypothetical protein
MPGSPSSLSSLTHNTPKTKTQSDAPERNFTHIPRREMGREFFSVTPVTMPMFHFQFEVQPNPTHPKCLEYEGAMACCWIQRQTLPDAESAAREWLAKEEWTIVATEDAGVITRETQLPDGMQYFQQAELDGQAFVIITSPAGGPDDENEA